MFKPLSLPDALTFEAEPLAAPAIDISGSEGMPLTAMRPSSIAKADRVRAPDIFKSGNGLKVRWINAGWCAAQMIYFKPMRDRAIENLIDDSVSHPVAKALPINAPISGVV